MKWFPNGQGVELNNSLTMDVWVVSLLDRKKNPPPQVINFKSTADLQAMLLHVLDT